MTMCGVEPRPPTRVRATAEHPVVPARGLDGRVRCIGRVRIPLALAYRPWATLYRMPDGRLTWLTRLWSVDRPVRRRLSTATLRSYARRNGFGDLLQEVDALVARALADGADAPAP